MIPAYMPKKKQRPEEAYPSGRCFSALFLQQIPDLGEQLHLFRGLGGLGRRSGRFLLLPAEGVECLYQQEQGQSD